VLPHSHRLRLRREFGVAARRGRRAGSSTLVVHLAASELDTAADPARVGFVVSRACGPAVVRNRIRRRLRHLVLRHLPDLPLGGLVVVRALPASATASPGHLEGDLSHCLDRLLTSTGTRP